MKTSTKLIVGFFTLVLLTITGFVGTAKYYSTRSLIEESGKMITKSGKIEGFAKLSVRGNIKVYLTQSNENRYELKGDENYVKNINIGEIGNTLNVHPDKGMRRSKNVELHLYFTNIEELKLSGGSSIDCLAEIKGERLTIDCSGGSSGTLWLNYKDIVCESSSGTNIEMKGTADNFTLDVSSGSNVDADGLLTKQCTVDGSSGANIQVNASDKLNVDVSSGAHLSYAGNPEVKKINTSSGGSANSD
ncbi:MAG TPA: head GIN domain-containing protein [Cytophagaceae bacterium]|jgi:hypothetical protein